ncbi:MAG: hypothetical protein RBT59_06635 [Arcobacteraceae bacterium]|jgi:hypothetical protein|nr:hypothetical protein [Arcobacteraceae bacterium]
MSNKKQEKTKKDFTEMLRQFKLKQRAEWQRETDMKLIKWLEEDLIKEKKTLHPWKEVVFNEISEEWKEALKREYCPDEFITLYMLQPLQIGKTFLNTKRKDRKERCGDCTFFGDKGCTTSYLEAKNGNFHTPACSEFSPKILGTKSTLIILDDPLKKD